MCVYEYEPTGRNISSHQQARAVPVNASETTQRLKDPLQSYGCNFQLLCRLQLEELVIHSSKPVD